MGRAAYDTDYLFEQAVNDAAAPLDKATKQQLMFMLMRPCRGCGEEASYEKTEYDVQEINDGVTRTFDRRLICKSCGHAVQLSGQDSRSVGRIIIAWNDSTLTIEASHV